MIHLKGRRSIVASRRSLPQVIASGITTGQDGKIRKIEVAG
ncbi:MAG: hypothetical protein ACLP51_03320 [Syntrophobacteraceae bacterium]